MFNKLNKVSASNGTNWDNLRKEQMREIIYQEDWTQDNIVYIRHCIKNYCGPSVLLWLEKNLKPDELDQIIKKFQLLNVNSETESIQIQNGNSAPIYLIQDGQINLYKDDKLIKSYTKSDILHCSFQQPIKLEFILGTQAFLVDRALFEEFQNKKENLERLKKIQSLSKMIPRLKKMDAQTQETILSHFKEVQKNKGSIVSAPEAGTANVFFLIKGTVVIFTLYKKQFTIVGCLKDKGVFNEQKLLFGRQSQYGAIVVNGEANLYQLEDPNKLEDEVEKLKGDFESKDRLYKGMLQRHGHNFEELQKKLCDKYGINREEVLTQIQANTKDGKIYTTDRQELKEKNLKIFNNAMGNDPLKNALQSMTEQEQTKLMGTPRVVSKQFMGLSHSQEASLFALRQMGTNIRKGLQTTNSVLPMDKTEIVKTKSSLLQSEKDFAQQLLQKKNFAEKKLQQNPDEVSNQSLNKFSKKKEELMEKYEERKKGEEDGSEFVSIKMSQNNEDDNAKPSPSAEQFGGRKEKRQNSQIGQSQRQMEIASKRKNLMKMGI